MKRAFLTGIAGGVFVFSPIWVHLAGRMFDRVEGLSADLGGQRDLNNSWSQGDWVGLATLLFTAFAFLVGWRALNQGAERARAERRYQTMSTLLSARFSAGFQKLKVDRQEFFPEYEDITYRKWLCAYTGIENTSTSDAYDELVQKRRSAQAVTELLNYYEFVAVGVRRGDLDEKLLKQSIRSIMCSLVNDCRYLIGGIRVRLPLAYENLVWLYESWRDDWVNIIGKPNEQPIPTEPGNDDTWPDPPGT